MVERTSAAAGTKLPTEVSELFAAQLVRCHRNSQSPIQYLTGLRTLFTVLMRSLERLAKPTFWICTGILVGLVLQVPLFKWALPEPASTVLSAAFGSLAGIAGVVVLEQRRALTATRATVSLVLPSLMSVRAGVRAVQLFVDADIDQVKRGRDLVEVLSADRGLALIIALKSLQVEDWAKATDIERDFLRRQRDVIVVYRVSLLLLPALNRAIERCGRADVETNVDSFDAIVQFQHMLDRMIDVRNLAAELPEFLHSSMFDSKFNSDARTLESQLPSLVWKIDQLLAVSPFDRSNA